jgi:hypothetical protein
VDLSGVSGAIIIGGDGTGQHIAIDSNEIMSKANATTVGELNIQADGGSTVYGTNTFGGFECGPSGARVFRVNTAGNVIIGVTDPGGGGALRVDGAMTLENNQSFRWRNAAKTADLQAFRAVGDSPALFEIAFDGNWSAVEVGIRTFFLDTDDVDLAGVSGAVIIGGDGTGTHLALDGDEIQAKGSATGASSLFIQNLGGTAFFGGAVELSNSNPQIVFTETDASADEQVWLFNAFGGQLRFRAADDAQSSVNNWLEVNRTLEAIDSVVFPNGSVIVGAADPGGTMQTRITNASGNLVRLDNSAATNLAWDMRLTSGGVLEFRSVQDNGTTVLNAMQIAHASGNMTLKGANLTMDRDVNHVIEMISTTVEAAHTIRGDANRTGAQNGLLDLRGLWNGDDVARIVLTSGADTTNKDDGRIVFQTQANSAGGLVSHVQLMEDGDLEILSTAYLDIKRNQALGGGAAATLGTIGGSGPATAAQNEWAEIKVGNNVRWVAVWA